MIANKSVIIGIVMTIVAVFFLLPIGYGAFSAEGAPGTPWATLSVPLNPSLSQTEQVTFYTQAQSIQPPNSIDFLGSRVVYSAWQTNAQGGQTALAVNQQSALSVLNVSSGPGVSKWYTLATTVTFSLTAACTAVGCVGTIYNFTILATAHVSTYWTEWVSPTTKMVFSNTPLYNTPQAPTAPPSQVSFNFEFFVPVFLILTIDFVLLAVAFPSILPVSITGMTIAVVSGVMTYAFWTGFAGL